MQDCFPFHHCSYMGDTCTPRGFLFCLPNQSAVKGSYFTLLWSKPCTKWRRVELHHTCIQFQEPYTNVLRQRYLQVPADLFTFIKEILKENITFHAASVSTKRSCLD